MLHTPLWKALLVVSPVVRRQAGRVSPAQLRGLLSASLLEKVSVSTLVQWLERRHYTSEELWSSIVYRDHRQLAYLLVRFRPRELVYIMKEEFGDHPVVLAIRENNLEAIEMMADVHLEQNQHLDVEYPSLEMFKCVVGRKNGQFLNQRYPKGNLAVVVDDCWITPAMGCVLAKQDQALKWTLAHPCFDPRVNANRCGTSVLHWAVLFGPPRYVKWALAHFDVNRANRLKKTPLYMAAELGQLKKLKILLKAGADPYLCAGPQSGPRSPFMAAVMAGHVQITKRLPKRNLHTAASNSGRVPSSLNSTVRRLSAVASSWVKNTVALCGAAMRTDSLCG